MGGSRPLLHDARTILMDEHERIVDDVDVGGASQLEHESRAAHR